ncbi:2'-5' RNA ligase family protein [Luteimonas sp. MJ246]|uniref:2'-5' RNA ligase family protein n=1 Tax=Luteimonas sp. MJ174 TaxID=3129237 RepID=UPI0031BA3421
MSGTLFTAWRPGADARGQLATLVAGIGAARPVDGPRLRLRRPDQWHATLCFIGQDAMDMVTPALCEGLADAARRIPAHVFQVARVAYWAGAGAVVALPRDCPELQALCDATRDAMGRCGITPLQATTQPHVTLAYLERQLPAQPWLDGVRCPGETLHVDGFELLSNRGGRYEVLGDWPLTGAPLPQAPRQAGLF